MNKYIENSFFHVNGR